MKREETNEFFFSSKERETHLAFNSKLFNVRDLNDSLFFGNRVLFLYKF